MNSRFFSDALFRRATWFGFIFTAAILAPAAEVWVAPTGSDQAAGTPDAPLATVSAALRKVREWRRTTAPAVAEGATIILRGGNHALSEPVLVRPEDAGTAASPTRIVAAKGESPVLSGGVPVSEWQPAAAHARAAQLPERLSLAARAAVWVAPVPEFNGRALEFRQLWVGGRKAVRARTPNDPAMVRITAWDKVSEEAGVPSASLAGVKDFSGVELVLLQMWEIAVLRVKSARIDGAEARLKFHSPENRVQFEHPWPPPVIKPEGNSPFFLANAPEFLDSPGEWWVDVRAGLVYYWPRAGDSLAHTVVTVPALETLVQIVGTPERPVEHVSFEGIGFAHTTWLRPSTHGHVPLQAGMFMVDAYKLNPKGTPDWRSLDNQAWVGRPPAGVEVAYASKVRFERCNFTQLAASGLTLGEGTRATTVEGCTFSDIGINGAQIGFFGTGAHETHLPWLPGDDRAVVAGVRFANNLLADTANEDWGGVAIAAGFARELVIEHNHIEDTSYSAISVGWGWTRTPNAAQQNRIHANRIVRFATRLADTAGIYTLSAQPGTIISENVIEAPTLSPWVHDPLHWGYIYLDEGSSFVTVRDNWSPEEKFIKNANGPGNDWRNNGPMVVEKIRAAAGLQPAFKPTEVAK